MMVTVTIRMVRQYAQLLHTRSNSAKYGAATLLHVLAAAAQMAAGKGGRSVFAGHARAKNACCAQRARRQKGAVSRSVRAALLCAAQVRQKRAGRLLRWQCSAVARGGAEWRRVASGAWQPQCGVGSENAVCRARKGGARVLARR